MEGSLLKKKSFSKNVLVYFFGGILAAGANFFLAPIYLRALSETDFGIWSQFLLFQQLFQIVMSWAMMAAMIRLLVGVEDDVKKAFIHSAINSCFILNIFIIIIFYFFLIIFNLKQFIDYEDLTIIGFALLSSSFFVFPSILMGYYIAHSEAIKFRSLSILAFLIQFTFIIVGINLFELDYYIAIGISVLGMFIFSSICLIILIRMSGYKLTFSHSKQLLLFSSPLIVYTLITQGYDMIIRFALLIVVTPEDFGIFSATLLYSSIAAMVASAINLSWAPLFFGNAEKWIINNIYFDYVKVSTSFIAIISCFLVVFWQEILTVYFGYLPDISTLFVGLLCISSWMTSVVWTAFTNPIFEKGLTKKIMIIAIKALIILAPFAYYLINEFDLLGTSMSLLSYSILICYFARNSLKELNIINFPIKDIISILILMLSVVFLLYFEQYYFGDSMILSTIFIFSIFLFLMLFPIYKRIPILIRKIESYV